MHKYLEASTVTIMLCPCSASWHPFRDMHVAYAYTQNNESTEYVDAERLRRYHICCIRIVIIYAIQMNVANAFALLFLT